MPLIIPNGKRQFVDRNGRPLASGRVYFYIPSTYTPKTTWQDSAGTIPNANPVQLDAYGQAVIFGSGAYRQLVLDSVGNQIWDEVTTTGVSAALEAVVGAASLSAAMTALGISTAMQPVVGAVSLSAAMSALGISAAMQPVVGAITLADARAAMGVANASYSVVNVKADPFNAVGDNVADDTAAIQAAIDSIASGTVYCPPGVYSVSGLTMKPGVRLVGEGRLASTLAARAGSINLIGYSAASLQNGFEVRDLGFSANGHSSVIAINLDGVDATRRISLVRLSDLYFGGLGQGIFLHYCANVEVQNCFANACNGGFWFDNCADVSAVTLYAQNGAGYGFYISGGAGAQDEGIRLVNCSTNGQTYGIGVANQDWGQMVNCSFTTCTGNPIVIDNATNWRIANSDIAAAAAVSGIVVTATCRNVQICNNYIALNNIGIQLLGSRHVVSDNIFQSQSNTDVDITALYCSVSGNVCESTGVPYSIVEQSPSDYNSFVGNVTNGTLVLSGGHSASAGNVAY